MIGLGQLREISQTILYDPDLDVRGVYGNCLQAAIASALGLELDAVPHFGAFTWWDAAVRMWLRGRSLDWLYVSAGEGLPSERCILVGTSPRPSGLHAVVAEGGRIWDPHPSRDGLTEIRGAYVFRSWPDGSDDDGRCFCCGDQLARLQEIAATKGAA
jgi:hypothetical protein